MKLGRVVQTSRIADACYLNFDFQLEIATCFQRYIKDDWGEMDEEDKAANDFAKDHEERVLAAYQTSKGRIYIITEWNREYTTILFCDEY